MIGNPSLCSACVHFLSESKLRKLKNKSCLCLTKSQTNVADYCRGDGNTCRSDQYKCGCPGSLTGTIGGRRKPPEVCISKEFLCDGIKDCATDEDEGQCAVCDEYQCGCFPRGRRCTGGFGCYRESDICDGISWCGDGSDEINCTCPRGLFQCDCYRSNACHGLRGCIAYHYVCDGDSDCGDGSDEQNCPKCDWSCFANGTSCIPPVMRCDSKEECAGGRDEHGCSCKSFLVGGSGTNPYTVSIEGRLFYCKCALSDQCGKAPSCVHIFRKCDGWNDCGDWSDEENCACSASEFYCRPKYVKIFLDRGCISYDENTYCDDIAACMDVNGNQSCNNSCPDNFTGCSHIGSGGLLCVEPSRTCDGMNDCLNWRDEMNCSSCNSDAYRCNCAKLQDCKQGRYCVPISNVCDGVNDCGDWSDETGCACSENHVRCGCLNATNSCTSHGRCISKFVVGNSVADCVDRSDEPCNATLLSKYGLVVNVCSRKSDCDLIEKLQAPHITQCFAVYQACSMRIDKLCGIKEWVCVTERVNNHPSRTKFKRFQSYKHGYKLSWTSGDEPADEASFCDPHRSGTKLPEKPGFKCSSTLRGKVCTLPQKNLYDNIPQCFDSSDLCLIDKTFKCFVCADNQLIISVKQVCNGIIDCYDLSDECFCQNQTVCSMVLGNSITACPPHQMHCFSGTDCLDTKEVLCNAAYECEMQRNMIFCFNYEKYLTCLGNDGNSQVAVKCDGKFECKSLEDECQCGYQLPYCNDSCIKTLVDKAGRPGVICDGFDDRFPSDDCPAGLDEEFCPMRFQCGRKERDSRRHWQPTLKSIPKERICDGLKDCQDGSDENKTVCQNEGIFCDFDNDSFSNSSFVRHDFVCDGIRDCDDNTDESHELCSDNRFYCFGGDPLSIDKKFLEDGVNHCFDGSDECRKLFSGRNELITFLSYRLYFWSMGSISVVGNLFILACTVRKMSIDNFFIGDLLIRRSFVLNLSFAGFLMGLYMLVVVARGKGFSGTYCLEDKKWRSSQACSILGSVALFSAETSIFIMAALTTFRVTHANCVQLRRTLKIERTVIACFACWALAAALSLVPWIEFPSGYFVSSVWVPNAFYPSDQISRNDLFLLSNRVSNLTAGNSTSKQWSVAKQKVSALFPELTIKAEFGFYGKSSICAPHLFGSGNDLPSEYSMFIVAFNVLLLLYVICGNFVIYRNCRRVRDLCHNDPNNEKEKPSFCSSFVAFVCWFSIFVINCVAYSGVFLSPKVYLISAGLLFPASSALGPILSLWR